MGRKDKTKAPIRSMDAAQAKSSGASGYTFALIL